MIEDICMCATGFNQKALLPLRNLDQSQYPQCRPSKPLIAMAIARPRLFGSLFSLKTELVNLRAEFK